VIGLARLRALADASALAAGELVTLIEQRDGWAAAAGECERQLRKWPAPQLTLRLLDLHEAALGWRIRRCR
jgi:lipopolysaccharide biosynthesis regulator YciM